MQLTSSTGEDDFSVSGTALSRKMSVHTVGEMRKVSKLKPYISIAWRITSGARPEHVFSCPFFRYKRTKHDLTFLQMLASPMPAALSRLIRHRDYHFKFLDHLGLLRLAQGKDFFSKTLMHHASKGIAVGRQIVSTGSFLPILLHQVHGLIGFFQ